MTLGGLNGVRWNAVIKEHHHFTRVPYPLPTHLAERPQNQSRVLVRHREVDLGINNISRLCGLSAGPGEHPLGKGLGCHRPIQFTCDLKPYRHPLLWIGPAETEHIMKSIEADLHISSIKNNL